MNKNSKENLVKSATCPSEEFDVAARKARIEKVASILKTVPYATESDRLDATLSFAHSTLDEQQIERLAARMRPEYEESKNAQIYRKGVQ